MDYKITCKDCIHYQQEVSYVCGVAIFDPMKPPYCDYIKGTTSANHPACTLGGFKLKVDK
ncbi:MAG: hypothetical protein IKO90_09100 [Bacteroidales bacterium]|nr:hypothetical protein [Bacteroidales bacterium]